MTCKKQFHKVLSHNFQLSAEHSIVKQFHKVLSHNFQLSAEHSIVKID